jgi:hypothetical protein
LTQDIWEEKVEKDFMTILTDKIKRSAFIIRSICILAIVVFEFNSCTPDLSDDPIPFQPFDDIVINLSLPAYVSLATDQGSKYVSGGIKGIIIYRKSASTYLAFERNCSYHPNEACSNVDVHASTIYMEDSCCGSTFSFPNGEPTGGPAWRPLRQYITVLNGNQLTITDDIL